VPAHWDVERARWLFRERDERSEQGEEVLLTVSHLSGVSRREDKAVNMFMAESLEGYKIAEPNDLVINTMWAWMGAAGVAQEKGLVSPAYNVYAPSRYDAGYLDFLCRTPRLVAEMTRLSKGVWSSRLRLYPESFFEIRLPVPPLEEQRAICKYLQDEMQRLDTLAATMRESLSLLFLRRAALIAASVSGQAAASTS